MEIDPEAILTRIMSISQRDIIVSHQTHHRDHRCCVCTVLGDIV